MPPPLALDVLNKILARSGVQTLTTLRSAHDPDSGGPVIDITGEDAGLLIGRRGETLRALQYIVNLAVKNTLKDVDVRVSLDVERYRERRNNSLHEMALRWPRGWPAPDGPFLWSRCRRQSAGLST